MITVRAYGTAGPTVVVLHGGPGAPGEMAPVARELANSFRVLEPLQRGSGGEPLTVAIHVQDLREVILEHCGAERPSLVGYSWGAMLALAYAAEHPTSADPIVLAGCGTFDPVSRSRMQKIINERMTPELRDSLRRLESEISDPDQRFRAVGKLIDSVYSVDPIPREESEEAADARGFEETWNDMLRLQREGIYPAKFAAIRSPVLMLHGSFDPHPGKMIRDSLLPYLPQLEYVELPHCGHTPWRERVARDEFFAMLRSWLARRV